MRWNCFITLLLSWHVAHNIPAKQNIGQGLSFVSCIQIEKLRFCEIFVITVENDAVSSVIFIVFYKTKQLL